MALRLGLWVNKERTFLDPLRLIFVKLGRLMMGLTRDEDGR
jgi:hypothetical protein